VGARAGRLVPQTDSRFILLYFGLLEKVHQWGRVMLLCGGLETSGFPRAALPIIHKSKPCPNPLFPEVYD
jgi:hypothetical protein